MSIVFITKWMVEAFHCEIVEIMEQNPIKYRHDDGVGNNLAKEIR